MTLTDQTPYFALCLTTSGEARASDGTLPEELARLLYLPEPPHVICPGGYALLAWGGPPQPLSTLAASPLIESVLSAERAGAATPVAVSPDRLAALLAHLSQEAEPQPPTPGTHVRITGGDYRGFQGVVLNSDSQDSRDVDVRIPLRTRDFVVRVLITEVI